MTGRSSRLEDMRADSIRRTNVCTERRVDSNYKELTQSIIRADSKTSEPTRASHTSIQRLYFQPVFKLKNPKRLHFKSQRSESLKSSLKGEEAPLKETKKEREKEKRNCTLIKTYSYQKPKESQGEPKAAIISSTKIKRPLGEIKKII